MRFSKTRAVSVHGVGFVHFLSVSRKNNKEPFGEKGVFVGKNSCKTPGNPR